MALLGYMPPLPHTAQAHLVQEETFVISILSDAVIELQVLENHMKTCDAEYHHPHRCDLMERIACAQERLQELHVELGTGEN